MSKKDKRRAKKEQKESQKGDILLKCNVCKAEFDSKNKLFKHINSTGHALRV